MKTNFDTRYKTNPQLENAGVWFAFPDCGAEFLVKRFGGANAPDVKKKMAKYYKPYAKQIEMNLFPEDKAKDIMIRIFVESCILDWKGIEINGEQKEFDVETCIELFKHLPELCDQLTELATDSVSYREELGNS